MTELVCFDCDGVLVESELLAAKTTVDCLSELGISISKEEVLAKFTGKSAEDTGAYIRQTYGIDLPSTYQRRFNHLLFQHFQAELQPVSGMNEVLTALRRPCCVTSNSGHDRLSLTLALTGLAEHFGPHVFSAEDVAKGKPSPDLFYFAAKRMGVEVTRCLVIDDSPTGIEGAVAAGAQAIGFTGGGHTTSDHIDRLMAAGACCTVASTRDLMPLICGDDIPLQ